MTHLMEGFGDSVESPREHSRRFDFFLVEDLAHEGFRERFCDSDKRRNRHDTSIVQFEYHRRRERRRTSNRSLTF